jgi:hypothetical protein
MPTAGSMRGVKTETCERGGNISCYSDVLDFVTSSLIRGIQMRGYPNRVGSWGLLCTSCGSIPCECGTNIDERGSPLAVRLREHAHNFKKGFLGEQN